MLMMNFSVNCLNFFILFSDPKAKFSIKILVLLNTFLNFRNFLIFQKLNSLASKEIILLI